MPKRVRRPVVKHTHFAVRQIPYEIFVDYNNSNDLVDIDNVLSTKFCIEDDKCTVYIELDGDPITVDKWQYEGALYNIVTTQLPKQVFRSYKESKQLQFINNSTFYEDDHIPTVEIDLGDKVDIWRWVEDKPNDDGRIFYTWSLVDSKPSDGDKKELRIPNIDNKWVYIDKIVN